MEIHEQAAEIEEAAALFQIDQEINVASFIGIASRYGSEDTDVAGPSLSGDPENFFSAGS